MHSRSLLPLALAAALVAPAASAAEEKIPGDLTEFTYHTGEPRAPEQEAVVFELADLSFKVDPANKHLDGDAKLTFRALKPIDKLVVELDNRNFKVALVEVDGQAVPAGKWTNPEGRMTVPLAKPLAAGEKATLRIKYDGKPHVAERAPWDGGFVWAKAPTGEPWVASAIQGNGCDLFWPCIDHPQGEPLQVDEHVTVPAPLVAAGNGVAMGMEEKDGWRTYHWRTKNPDTYAISLNIGPYEVLEKDYKSRYGNTIPLRFWHLKDRTAKATELFEEFSSIMDFFEEVIGPYPFGDEKMGVVETPHLGMEHQTINAYGNEYKKSEYGYDWLLQHEFAHEWFGNQLTNKDWDDMWLHEGLGTYMQPLYMQWLRGDMEYHANLMKQRATISNQFPIVSGKPMREADVYSDERGPGHDIYYKASLVMDTLRHLLGDKAFFDATRQAVYGTTTPKPGHFKPVYGDTKDYIAAVKQVTGKDYQWFFDVYLYQPALPELVATRSNGTLNLQWKTGGKPFPMPVEVRVGDKVETVAMANGQGSLKIADDQSFTLDPHSKVLRKLAHIDAFQKDRDEREKEAARKKAAGGN